MALLWMESFDHQASADLGRSYVSYGGSINTATKRTGRASLNNGGVTRAVTTTSDTVTQGAAMYFVGSTGGYLLQVSNAAGPQISCTALSDGSVVIRRGDFNGTSLATSSPGVLTLDQWNYVEFQAKVTNTSGFAEVRINENSVVSYPSGDTQYQSDATITTVQLSSIGVAVDYVDDWYVVDSLGTANNTFLGDVKVQYLQPDGDGAYTAWTCSTGSVLYSLLDDEDADTDGTDFVSSSTVGSTFTVTLEALEASTATVLGVQLVASLTKTDAGSREVTGAVYSSASLYTNATPVAPGNGTYQYATWIYETDPATAAAWTTSSVNALQVGAQVTT